MRIKRKFEHANNVVNSDDGRNMNRRQDIQGLRAIAVLMVIAFHAGFGVTGGFTGVDAFFVISGFVISSMLHREWSETGRIQFVRFYVRRFKRLTPALASTAIATIAISGIVLSPMGPQQTAAKTAYGAMLLVANVVIAGRTGGYFDAPAETNPLLNTWSLSVEEQFYLAFPALLAIAWLLARRIPVLKSAPFLIVGFVAAVSFVLAVVGSSGHALPTRMTFLFGFYSPATRAWEFAVGAMLAMAQDRFVIRSCSLAFIIGLLGIGLLAASLWLIDGATSFPGFKTLLPVSGALLVLLAGKNSSNAVTRLLSTRTMVKIGDWSYSLYLWHWPFIVFVTGAKPRAVRERSKRRRVLRGLARLD